MAAEFKRKANITTSVPVSSVRPDMFEGNIASTKIGGSKHSQSLLNRFTIPNKPTYGDARLARLDAAFYVSSITQAPGISHLPEATIFKARDSDKFDLTEGAQELHPERSDIVIFTSRPDEFASISENFNGSNTAGYDATEYIHSKKTTIMKEQHYIWPNDLYRVGAHASNSWYQGWGLYNEWQDYSKAEIRDRYGVSAAEFANGGLANNMSFADGIENTLVVPVKLTGNTPKGFTNYGKNRTVYAEASPIAGKEGKTLKIMEREKSNVQSTGPLIVEKEDSAAYGDEVTPENSIFEIVQGDTEHFGDSTTTSAAELLATATVRFNTDKYLTGGQSCEMKAFWSHSAEGDDVKYAPKGKLLDGSTSSKSNLQQCKMVKTNIPFPIKHPAKPSLRGAEQLGTGQDANYFANNIEIDLNIGALALANEPTSGVFTLDRSFIICFSHLIPSSDDDFFTFAEKHGDTAISYSSNTKTFMDTATTNDSTVKPFSFVAFLNDADKGILMCQPASVFDTSTTTMNGQHTVPASLNNNYKAVTIPTGVADNHAIDITDRWIRLNFLFAPQTYTDAVSGLANGGMGARQRAITGSGRGYGAGGGTHCVMIMSDAKGGNLVDNTLGGGSTTYPFFELNNITQTSSTTSLDNWPRHLSLWVCNSEGNASGDANLDDDVTTDTRVYIDKIEFKDFNVEIENPNVKDFNLSHDAINIAAGKAYMSVDGKDTSSDAQDWTSNPTASAFRIDTPTTFAVGAKNPKKLGYVSGNSTTRQGAMSDLLTALYLQDFKCGNLAMLEEIPDSNMIGTYSFAGGDALEDDGSTAIEPHWGENHNTHYGLSGFVSNTNIGAQTINSYEHGGVDPQSNFALKDFNSGFICGASNTDAHPRLRPDGSDQSALGGYHRFYLPFRIGDSLVIRAGDGSNGTQRVSKITNVEANSSDSLNDIEVTIEDSVEYDDLDEVYFRPEEGVVKNWTSKGIMTFNIGNHATASTNANRAFSKRECTSASARVLEIDEISDSRVTFKVDTLKPLRLDSDEEFIVYLYGQPMTSADWTRTDNSYDATADEPRYSQTVTSELDSTCNNAKAGLKIDSIDERNNLVTMTWDGKAQNGSTLMATYDNIPVMMISPYRYWGYMNIDVKDSDGLVLPPRSYGSFSVVKNLFARWDGTYFENDAGNALTVNEAIDATETTLTLNGAITAGADFGVGTYLGIENSDEVMYISKINSTTEIQVIRGVCETYVSNPTAVDSSITPWGLLRTAGTHSTGMRLKKVKVHWANGDEVSGNLTRLTSGGNLDTLAERQNLGTTFKENPINFSTVSGVNGAYSNPWTPHVINEDSIYDLQDFGFGAFNDETSDGGYLGKTVLKSGQYNKFKLWEIKKSAGFDVNEQCDLLLRMKDDKYAHLVSVNTRHAESNTPYVTAIFEDDLPKPFTLTVAPNEDDPFYPQFKWDAIDSDLWYGILQISRDPQVISQYDGIVAHIPLNEETSVNTGVFLENENGTKTAATAGAFTDNLEGLAGNCKEFDGTDDYLTFADYTAPSDEMSIVAHVIPSSSGSGTRTILSKWNNGGDSYNDYELEMLSNNKIQFSVLANGATTMTSVTGPVIPTDGETPTAIIGTIDTNARSRNLKLYYNGKLVAQSKAANAGASDSDQWEGGGTISGTDADVEDDSGVLYVGCNANAAGTRADFWKGRIEEIAIYNRIIYPVVPSLATYTLDRALLEVDSNFSSPIEYTCKLFLKDYHNIRGKKTEEVAASPQISYQKAAFGLGT